MLSYTSLKKSLKCNTIFIPKKINTDSLIASNTYQWSFIYFLNFLFFIRKNFPYNKEYVNITVLTTYIQIKDISNITVSFLGLFLSQYPLKDTTVLKSVIISGQNSDFEFHVNGIIQYILLYVWLPSLYISEINSCFCL